MIPGIKINLDGTDYVMPPLSLGALEMLQDRLTAVTGGVDATSASLVVDAAHAALKRNYPTIERAQVATMIGLENMGEVMQAVMDVAGIRRKEKEAGEATAPTP